MVTQKHVLSSFAGSKDALAKVVIENFSDMQETFFTDRVREKHVIVCLKDPWCESQYAHDNPKSKLYVVQNRKAKIKLSIIEFIQCYRPKSLIPKTTLKFLNAFESYTKDKNGLYSINTEEGAKFFIDYLTAVKEACVYRINNKKPSNLSSSERSVLKHPKDVIKTFIDSRINKKYVIVKRHTAQRLFSIIKRSALRNQAYKRRQTHEDQIYCDEMKSFRERAFLVQSDEFEYNDRFLSTMYVTSEVYTYGHIIDTAEYSLHAEHAWAKSNTIKEIKDNVIHAMMMKIDEERIIHYIGESLDLTKEMVLCFRFQENPKDKRIKDIQRFKRTILEKTGVNVDVSKIIHHNIANGLERYEEVTLLDKNGVVINKKAKSKEIRDKQRKLRIELHGGSSVKLK